MTTTHDPSQPKPNDAAKQEAGGGRMRRLVGRVYGRECDNDPERMLEMALRDLWRNYPEWPSTFSGCFNDECLHREMGRGGGLCAGCVTDCIAEIIGMNGPAEAMKRAIEECRMTARKLREMVNPANASDQPALGHDQSKTQPHE